MQRRQIEIRISETGTEYLLFIPANQRQRAKRIEPIKFDFSRRCWIYDRNLSNYYALIREFADDLTLSSSFTNPQEDEERWQQQEEIDYLRDTLLDKDEIISTKDDEIELLKAEGEQKDRENLELQEEVDRLRGIAESISSLEEQIRDKDRENDKLNRRNRELEKQVNTHQTTIDDLHQTLSEKEEKISTQEGKIERLEAMINKLEEQVDRFQDINTHPEIRDIAVEATGNNPAFGKYFKTRDIDKNLPIDLRRWLEARLKQALSISLNHKPELGSLIQEYTNFDVEYSKEPDEFDKIDRYLANVIRTQGNLSAHEEEDEEIYEKMIMSRALCCYFAAALLSSKLPEPKQPAFR